MTLTAAQAAFRVAMEAFLKDTLDFSDKNAASVLKTVDDLMCGRGLASEHLPGPRWLEGFAFDPNRHSAWKLRELGREWLPPRRPRGTDGPLDRVYDSKKGHTIDHAAGCLIKYVDHHRLEKPRHQYEPLPKPPPPPTAAQLQGVADRPFSAGGPKQATKRTQPAKKRVRSEPAAVAQKRPVPVSDSEEEQEEETAAAKELQNLVAGRLASGYYAQHAPKPPPPKNSAPVVDLKRPAAPDLDVQEARILFRNASLVKHLRTHPLGDWVKNPHRKIAGKETLAKTKEKAADAIKGVIREWLLTTPAGRRALAAAEVGEGELSIDRLIARHEKSSMNGLNCIYNLYLMPVRHNAYFGPELTPEKRTYVGNRAYQLAKAAHETFVRDTEGEYDWDRGFFKRAETIVNQC